MPSKIIKEIRSGHIRLSVWEHSDAAGIRKSVLIERLYKEGNRWQRTNSLKAQDLLDVVAVCLEANKFLRMEERWQGLSKRQGLIHKSPIKKP